MASRRYRPSKKSIAVAGPFTASMPPPGASLSPASMVIQAAIDGQGVALGQSVLVEADLAGGRLVKPFEPTIPLDYAYYVVCPESAAYRS